MTVDDQRVEIKELMHALFDGYTARFLETVARIDQVMDERQAYIDRLLCEKEKYLQLTAQALDTRLHAMNNLNTKIELAESVARKAVEQFNNEHGPLKLAVERHEKWQTIADARQAKNYILTFISLIIALLAVVSHWIK